MGLDQAKGACQIDVGVWHPKWSGLLQDFVFLCAILIGYSFLFEGASRQMVYALIPIFGSFMTSSYLAFAATNEFKITYLRHE